MFSDGCRRGSCGNINNDHLLAPSPKAHVYNDNICKNDRKDKTHVCLKIWCKKKCVTNVYFVCIGYVERSSNTKQICDTRAIDTFKEY